MVSFFDLANQRCSTRKYRANPIPRELIDQCLEAARLAPSACNSQPWSFVVVDDASTKQKLAQQAFVGIYSLNTFVAEAPVIIVVITERSKYHATLGGYFRRVQYNLLDVGIACDHLVLQAAELGIGTCWLGWFNEKAVKRVLNIPKGKRIDVLISMGYSACSELRPKQRRPLEEIRVYHNPQQGRGGA